MTRKSKRAVAETAAASDTTAAVDPLKHKRRLVADLCKMLGATATRDLGAISEDHQGKPTPSPDIAPPPTPKLSPRMRQTLDRLLVGDSEKQIARRMGLSRHTVHVYVKALYKGFAVSSRGELLARFVRAPQYLDAQQTRDE